MDAQLKGGKRDLSPDPTDEESLLLSVKNEVPGNYNISHFFIKKTGYSLKPQLDQPGFNRSKFLIHSTITKPLLQNHQVILKNKEKQLILNLAPALKLFI